MRRKRFDKGSGVRVIRPEMKDAKSAYQNGLIDVVRGDESASALLHVAGEQELLDAYMRGVLEGHSLLRRKK